MPIYYSATHLGAAIDSVLSQDFTDFELIIIDDNSPDQTSDVVLSYQDARIRLGFRTATVFYERNARFAGESKYPLTKMLALAVEGITSFSVMPLRMITWLGLIVSLGSLLMVIWIVFGKYFMQSTIPGWASSVIPIYFIGGVQLLSLGILGEYLSKIYMETKQRPHYLIEETI
jgi:glycosyltransferase involved in cell wall biosynthesis